MQTLSFYDNPPAERAARARTTDPAIVIECVCPRVEGGEFAVKRELGDWFEVSADIYRHGHEILGAALLHRASGSEEWEEAPMAEAGNDRWQGGFHLERLGEIEYAVVAWVERFASWRRDTGRKQEAGQDIGSDVVEGVALVRQVLAGHASHPGEAARRLRRAVEAPETELAVALLDPEVAAAMQRLARPPLPDLAGAPQGRVLCERERARFGSWYEMFPRSQGTVEGRSATLREAEARLPEIAAMGFEVLYLPPIHPIGRTHRKGRNNSLLAAPGDPGSPYAIGSAEGGHDALEPGLGTLADFDHFVAAAAGHGLEIALDFAVNCSPDHPWVRQHPEWFHHRPDGTIKYAENPPKRYEDIYPLNFEGAAAPALARELSQVLRFWAARGVRIFRVDNPHTKPLPMWEWLLADVRAAYPDAIFLSEAFTRPKPMKRLAKLGFSQSYTYFTWRNTKPELTEYVTELAQGSSREYLRPNFFVNTPDILPEILQVGGRPAFLQRLVLAATLAPAWGMYSGFELCENRALPHSEEYQDSEKYQFKVWDWDRPGNIKDWVARLNQIRREHPALQRLGGVRFLPAGNDRMLFYARHSPGFEDVLAIAVNLDPSQVQEGPVEIPGPELGLGENFTVNDLLAEPRGLWRGRHHWLRLDPQVMPAVVLELKPAR